MKSVRFWANRFTEKYRTDMITVRKRTAFSVIPGPGPMGRTVTTLTTQHITVGMENALIGSVASGQALEDEIQKHHSCLALTDELDELMMAIRQDRSGTRQNLAKVLMELFTSASVPYQTRAKANQDRYHIDQPNLCLMGTAVPEHFYNSISARMMDDGFLGRALIIEAGKLGPRQRCSQIEIPADILEIAQFWADNKAQSDWDYNHPRPRTVFPNQDAASVLEKAAEKV